MNWKNIIIFYYYLFKFFFLWINYLNHYLNQLIIFFFIKFLLFIFQINNYSINYLNQLTGWPVANCSIASSRKDLTQRRMLPIWSDRSSRPSITCTIKESSIVISRYLTILPFKKNFFFFFYEFLKFLKVDWKNYIHWLTWIIWLTFKNWNFFIFFTLFNF